MIEFRAPRIEDRTWIAPLLASTKRENCEYCFGNIYAWSPIYHTHIARYEDFFVACGTDDDGDYCFPMGTGDLRGVLEALFADAAQRGRRLRFFGVTASDRQALETLYPDRFAFTPDRDFFDYVYAQADLALLPGKKYHAKRNHISAFERDGAYTYERLTARSIADCAAMEDKWLAQNSDKNPQALRGERTALLRALEQFEPLGLVGALLRRDGEVIAFTVGEPMGEHMFCTHFEKAFADVRGAYPMINRAFAAEALSAYAWINREEDTGDAGLRQAKLSYHPARFIDKYEAVCLD